VQITNAFKKKMVQITHVLYILGQFLCKLTTAYFSIPN